jgi:hypothetical protein
VACAAAAAGASGADTDAFSAGGFAESPPCSIQSPQRARPCMCARVSVCVRADAYDPDVHDARRTNQSMQSREMFCNGCYPHFTTRKCSSHRENPSLARGSAGCIFLSLRVIRLTESALTEHDSDVSRSVGAPAGSTYECGATHARKSGCSG